MIITAQNVDIINFYKIFAIHYVFYKLTVNQLVVGSIPTAGASKINTLAVLRGVFLSFGQTYS